MAKLVSMRSSKGKFWAGNRDMSKKGRSLDSNLGRMAAAMIPGAKVDQKGRIMLNVGTSKETVVFNIGGVTFETYRSTLHRLPNSPLADENFLKDHYRPEKKEYFFDRDPDIFRATLNYLRNGELHLPSYICGPAAKTELEYWGVLPSKIERCCWTNYNDWNSTLHALQQLDADRRGSMLDIKENHLDKRTWLDINKPRIWNFLNNPHSSVYAKCFGIFSLFFVFASMFSFVASTTATFNVCDNSQIESISENVSVLNGSIVSTKPPLLQSTNRSSVNGGFNNELVRVKHTVLLCLDMICLVYFTFEYMARLVFAPRRLKFVTSTMGVVDLIAILPDNIELIILAARPDLVEGCEVPFIAFARILRVLRIFRLIKFVPGLWILVYTLRASIGELILLACFMSLGILLFSSLIYFVDSKETFASIPDGFWWALITMTTVGYGDMYPTTSLGKLVGSVCAMTGLLMIGFSVPALVNNFMLYYKHVHYSIQAERMAEYEQESNANKQRGLNGFRKQSNNPLAGGFSAVAILKCDKKEKQSLSMKNGQHAAREIESSPLMTATNNNVESNA